MASEYVLSARLRVEGANDFVSDLDKAKRAARDAQEAFAKLDKVDVAINLKGVKDFEDDSLKAAVAAFDLHDALTKLKDIKPQVTLRGAEQFEKDLQNAQVAARDAGEAFKKLDNLNIKIKMIGAEAFDDDLMTAAGSATDLIKMLEKLDKAASPSLSMRGVDAFINSLDRVETAVSKAVTYFEQFNDNPLRFNVVGNATELVGDLRSIETAVLNVVEAFKILEANGVRIKFDEQGAAAHLARVEEAAREAHAALNALEDDPVNLASTGAEQLAAGLNAARTAAQQMGMELKSIDSTQVSAAAEETSRLSKFMGSITTGIAYNSVYAAFQAIGQGARYAFDEIVGMDRAITNAMSIQPQNMPLVQGFQDVARTISRDLGMPVSQVAEGFYHLASAGFDAETQLDAIGAVAKFAKSGLTDMETATLRGSQALAIFKPAGYDMTTILDEIAMASNVSLGDLNSFADALTNKAGTAAVTFGQSLEDTLGVLAAFAERGVQGKAAGEQYSIVLRDLALKANKNKDAFAEFGLAVYDSGGKMRPILDIISDLQSKFAGMSDAERTAELAHLGFTLRSQTVMMALLQMGDSAKNFSEDMKNAAGVVDRMVTVQLTSLETVLARLKSFAVDVTIDVTTKGFDKLVEFATFLRDTFAPAIEALSPAVAAFAQGFGAVFATIGEGLLTGVVVGLQALSEVMQTVGNFASQHTDAMFAFGAAVATFTIGNAAAAAISTLLPMIQGIGETAAIAAMYVGDMVKALASGNLSSAGSALSGLIGAINPVTVALGAVAIAAGVAFLEFRKQAEEARDRAEALLKAMQETGIAAQDMATAILIASGRIQDTGDDFDTLRQKALAAISSQLIDQLGGASTAFARLGLDVDTVSQALATGTDLFALIGTNGSLALQNLGDASKNADGPLKDVAKALYEGFLNGQITNSELQALGKAFDNVADSSDDAIEKLAEFARKNLEAAIATGQLTEKELALLGVKKLSKASAEEIVEAYAKWKGKTIEAAEAHDDARFKQLKSTLDANRGPIQNATGDLGGLQQSAQEAADAFQELLDTTDKLVNGPLNKLKSEADWQKAMIEFAKNTKDAAFSLDATTEAGRKSIDSFKGLVEQGVEWAKVQSGGNAEEYAKRMKDLGNSVAELIIPLVGSREKAVELLKQFGLFPDKIAVGVNVRDDLGEAQARMREYTDADYTTNVKAQADLAMAQSDLAGLTNENRVAHITADAHTETAGGKLADVTNAPRVAGIGVTAHIEPANSNIDGVAKAPRTAYLGVHAETGGANDALNGVAGAPRTATIRAIAAKDDAEWQLNNAARDRTATISVYANVYYPPGYVPGLPNADGRVLDFYANGGMAENHVAQIASAGTMRVWAEPETGGEAYIPLAAEKRQRSLAIWQETGRRLGVKGFADGGMAVQSAQQLISQQNSNAVTVKIGSGAVQANVSAAVGADPNHLASKIQDAIGPALDEFALNLTTAIRRRG